MEIYNRFAVRVLSVFAVFASAKLSPVMGSTPQTQPVSQKATIEELAKRDFVMGQRLQMRNDLVQLTDALAAQVGEQNPSVVTRRADLTAMNKEIEQYAAILCAEQESRAVAEARYKESFRGLIAVPKPEDWAKIDPKMDEMLRVREGMRQVIAALTARYGDAHESVSGRKEELRLTEEQIAEYAEKQNEAFELRLVKVPRAEAVNGVPHAVAYGEPTIFGNLSGLKSIVFVCDASGSMSFKFATLRAQLQRVIATLDEKQAFNVIFFHDGRATALDSEKLLTADVQNREKARKFLNEAPVNSTSDPIPSLRVAFKQQPDMLFLVTDGDFPDNDAVVKAIRELNPNLRTRVSTIAFVDPEKDKDTKAFKLLEGIAKENAGSYNYVDETKLPSY